VEGGRLRGVCEDLEVHGEAHLEAQQRKILVIRLEDE